METNNTKAKEKKVQLEEKLEALAKIYEEKIKALEGSEKPEKKTDMRLIRDVSAKKADDYVEIRLFKDGDKYKDDVLVGINGYMCRIRRGVPVKIKRSFAKVISDSEDSVANVNADFLIKDGKMERYF